MSENNHSNNERASVMAGEYVLGTLQGEGRRIFEELLPDDSVMQQRVRQWEAYFSGLDDDTKPLSPPARVWRKIKKHTQPMVSRPAGLWHNPSPWRILALGAITASLFLAVLLIQSMLVSPVTEVYYVSMIRDQDDQTLWVIQASVHEQQLTVNSVRPPTQAERKKAFQLWLLPRTGEDSAPRSMGLLPVSGRQQLPLLLADKLFPQNNIAVSLEPPGGSPTGQPTGPVLFVADLVPI